MFKKVKKNKKVSKKVLDNHRLTITVTDESSGEVVNEYHGVHGYVISKFQENDLETAVVHASSAPFIDMPHLQSLGIAALEYAKKHFV